MGGISSVFRGLYISSIIIFSQDTIINIILSNIQINMFSRNIFKSFVFIIKMEWWWK